MMEIGARTSRKVRFGPKAQAQSPAGAAAFAPRLLLHSTFAVGSTFPACYTPVTPMLSASLQLQPPLGNRDRRPAHERSRQAAYVSEPSIVCESSR